VEKLSADQLIQLRKAAWKYERVRSAAAEQGAIVASDPKNTLNSVQMYQLWMGYWVAEQNHAVEELKRLEGVLRAADLNAYVEKRMLFDKGKTDALGPAYESATRRLATCNFITELRDVRAWLETYVDGMHKTVTMQQVNQKALEIARAKAWFRTWMEPIILAVIAFGSSAPRPVEAALEGAEADLEACFVAGTLVHTPDGLVPIEDLSVGGSVVTVGQHGEPVVERITHTFSRGVAVLVDLLVGSTAISCSPAHPFWVPGAGWQKAATLQPGSPLLSQRDGGVSIRSTVVRQGEFQVFNIEANGRHSYLVSDAGVLVHNKAAPAMRYKMQVFDEDWRGSGRTPREAIEYGFKRTGVDRGEFKVSKWGVNEHGKSFPTEYRVESGPNRGAEVNIDMEHARAGPDVPHVGWQTPGKRAAGGGARGHILLDYVEYNR
jgi:hypothetical protein